MRKNSDLKILPSCHGATTWCILANASMSSLGSAAYRELSSEYYYRNNKGKSFLSGEFS